MLHTQRRILIIFKDSNIPGLLPKDLLIVDVTSGKLSADITATKDPMLKRSPDNFEKHVKNIYRTLLTRGMKGCYVYFTDREAEGYFNWRMENRVF